MTTGSKGFNGTKTYLGYGGGTYLEGLEYLKTWTGGDRPAGSSVNSWHDYTMSYYRQRHDPAYEHIFIPGVVNSWIKGPYDMCGAPPRFVDPPAISDADLFNRISGMVSNHSFNALTTLGEGAESLRTIVDGARRISGSLSALKKGNLFHALTLLGITDNGDRHHKAPPSGVTFRYKNGVLTIRNAGSPRPQVVRSGMRNDQSVSIHETWLDLQYGWKPIIQSVFDAAEAFFDKANKPQRMMWRTHKRLAGSVKNYSAVRWDSWKNTLDVTLTVWQEEQYSAWDSLGLTDPASLAWELLPFSFVVDWFLPIGNYLQARHFASNCVGYYAKSSFKRQSYVVSTASLKAADRYYDHGGANTWDYVSLTRTKKAALSGSAVPLPGFKPLVDAASLQHVLNAIALGFAVTR